MKKLNYIILTLLSMFAMTWTACNDSIEWTIPEMSTEGRGVYFSNVAGSTVDLDRDANTFDVKILRSYTDCTETIALNVENESGLFTIPTEVTFKEGKSSANITIGYNPADFSYDDYKAIKLSVADASKTFTYGYSTYEFSAGVPAPYKSLGMATYREDFITTLFGVDNEEYEVELQENELYAGIYRLVNPYGKAYPNNEEGDYDDSKDYYMIINAQDPEGVYITQTVTGTDWGYGAMIMWSMADYYMVRGGYSLAEVKEMGYCGTLKDGIITFPTASLLFGMEGYNDAGLYYANQNGAFRVAFPGVVVGDYSIAVDYKGRFTDASGEINTAVANVTLGEDVELAKVAMAMTDDPNVVYAGILDGSIEAQELEKSQEVQFTLGEAGVYTIVAVSYITGEDGLEAREASYAQFEYTTGGSKWQSIGMAQYTEDLMGTFFNIPNVTYEVEIQESTETAGLYRLVYPYGSIYPYNGDGDYDTSRNYYLEINAVDPAGVYLPATAQGNDYGYGMVSVYSLAGYYFDGGNDFEAIKAAGYCGTLENGVITFPAETLLISMADYKNGSWYTSNVNGAFKVVLPGGTASAAAQAKSTSFDLCASISKAVKPNTEVAKFNAFKRVPNPRAKFIGR